MKAEEAFFAEQDAKKSKDLEKVSGIIQDLRIYQIELEMQNDELFRAQAEARIARDEYFDLYHEAPVGYATIGEDGCILKANRFLIDLVNREAADLNGLHIFDLVHEEDIGEFRARFRAFYNRPEAKEISFRIDRDNAEVYVTLTGRVTQISDGAVSPKRCLLVAFTDITKLKKSEFELVLAAKVFDSSIEGIVITDGKGEIQRVNRAFSLVTGYEEREVQGKTPAILKSGHHDHSFYVDMWDQLSREGVWQGEVVNKRKNGETYVEWLSISAVSAIDGRVKHYIGIFSDITEKKLNTQQMQQLAYYDVLTGLPNRTLFYDRLKQSLVRAKRNLSALALLFIDLDNFKELNDSYGHAEGDLLLQGVASRLKQTVRASDTVSRLGGDEFTIILSDFQDPNVISLESSKVAEKILAILSKPFQLKEVSYQLSASIGIAIYPQDGEVISELIKHADSAMYQAKSMGKNTFHFFSQQMFKAQQERSELKADLNNAIAEGQFVLHYQPQICLSTNEVVGCEALIRWNHSKRGLLPPGFFIGIAEDMGMINRIGDWVLEQAISQLRRWHDQGIDTLKIAINLSVEQIRDSRLPGRISMLLDRYDVPPDKLELEITESAMLKDTLESSQALQLVKKLGVRISLDDFGTGYSSMTYVKHFPVDSLKIDRVFVRDIFDSIEDKSIVLASISLANNLSVNTIAEGVETREQLDFLKDSGCTHVQGFLISKPLPVEAITKFISNYPAEPNN
ncbi:MAG: EAL domain-containing protein [Chromatiales bacterium]|nr:EAL domain-containing protein [Chromatiales bacterium]